MGLAGLLIASAECAHAQEQPLSPFAPGETLTYDVMWSVFPAGTVKIFLSKIEGGQKDAYEATASARSQGFVSLLYSVQNESHSFFDPRSVCSERISKRIKEGRRHKQTEIVFDATRKLAILDERDLAHPSAPPKHAENEIPACVEDVLSAFYYVRRQPLAVGQQIHVPINDGAKTFDVTADVQAREQIQTPLGTQFAFRVEPKVFGGLYKRKGRMLIWFSDDPQRLPLRIKAMISVGAITGNLRSVTVSPGTSPSSDE